MLAEPSASGEGFEPEIEWSLFQKDILVRNESL